MTRLIATLSLAGTIVALAAAQPAFAAKKKAATKPACTAGALAPVRATPRNGATFRSAPPLER